MKLLLDTHVLLWAAAGSERLSRTAAELIGDSAHSLHYSAASLWEIVIKQGLGRPDFTVDASLLRRGLLDNGFAEVPIDSAHALMVVALPPLHKDPFDRILLAQAHVEGMLLLTADDAVMRYGGPVQRI